METDRQYTFFLAGSSSYYNRGCEAIVRSTAILLRDAFGNCRFYSAYYPDKYCRDKDNEFDPDIVHLPMPEFNKYSLKWFLNRAVSTGFLGRGGSKLSEAIINYCYHEPIWDKAIRDSDAVLMVGGDLFTLSFTYPDRHFRIIELAKKYHKPVVLWGASVGPFSKDKAYERWAAAELRTVTRIYARERETVRYLDSIGVSENVELVADPAFWLSPAPVELPLEITEALKQGAIGINLSPLAGDFRARYTSRNFFTLVWHNLRRQVRAEKNYADWVALASSAVESVIEKTTVPVVLIPHVMSDSGKNKKVDDYLFLEHIYQNLRRYSSRLFLVPRGLNAGQSKWVIGQCKVFAGARTHSTIAAISSNVPTLFIAYSQKARGLSRDIFGDDRWLMDVAALSPEALAVKLTLLLEAQEEIRAYLMQKNQEFRMLAQAAAWSLKAIVRDQESVTR